MKPETKAKIAESQRLRHPPGSTYDVEAMYAAIRSHPTYRDAAKSLGLLGKVFQSRIARLAKAGKLPPDIMAIRQRNIDRPSHDHNRPKPKRGPKTYAHHQVPRSIPRTKPIPDLPPYDGPRTIIELPTPVWPLPKAAEPVNQFNQRRLANARARAEQTWSERNGGMTR